jgi:ABC-2 type transport system permease protein
MPLFFASNAIYPIALMPLWLQRIALANPLTYMVDALRTLMLAQAAGTLHVLVDVGVLLGAGVVLIAINARLLARLA